MLRFLRKHVWDNRIWPVLNAYKPICGAFAGAMVLIFSPLVLLLVLVFGADSRVVDIVINFIEKNIIDRFD